MMASNCWTDTHIYTYIYIERERIPQFDTLPGMLTSIDGPSSIPPSWCFLQSSGTKFQLYLVKCFLPLCFSSLMISISWVSIFSLSIHLIVSRGWNQCLHCYSTVAKNIFHRSRKAKGCLMFLSFQLMLSLGHPKRLSFFLSPSNLQHIASYRYLLNFVSEIPTNLAIFFKRLFPTGLRVCIYFCFDFAVYSRNARKRNHSFSLFLGSRHTFFWKKTTFLEHNLYSQYRWWLPWKETFSNSVLHSCQLLVKLIIVTQNHGLWILFDSNWVAFISLGFLSRRISTGIASFLSWRNVKESTGHHRNVRSIH